jgi:hypothetical protein
MKSYLVVFILLIHTSIFTQSFVDQDEIKVEAHRRKLSGIKSCTKMDYTYSFGKMSSSGELLEYIEYNKDGFYLLKKIYEDGQIKSYEVCEYDEDNNLVAFSEFDSFYNLIYKRINKYKNSIQSESVNFDMNGNYHYKEIYKYDSQNNCTGKDVFTWDGNLYYKHIYNYNHNKLVEEVFYDTLGNIHQKVIYEYSKNKKIKESLYDDKGIVFEERLYEYPSKNKTTIKTNYYFTSLSPEPVKTNLTKVTNGKDLIIEEYSEKENKIINWRNIFRYDKNGNPVEEIHHNSLDEPVSSITYKYEYFPK